MHFPLSSLSNGLLPGIPNSFDSSSFLYSLWIIWKVFFFMLIVKEVHWKWKIMRDCFRREPHLQKQKNSGGPGTKRWIYIYFEQVQFLMLQAQDRATSSSYSPMTGSNGEGESDERREDEAGSGGGTSETAKCRKQQRDNNNSRKINNEHQLPDIYGTKRLNTLMRAKLSRWRLYQHLKTWTMTRINGQRWKCWVLWEKPKIRCFSHTVHKILPQRLLYHRRMSKISNLKTHLHCQIFQTTEL